MRFKNEKSDPPPSYEASASHPNRPPLPPRNPAQSLEAQAPGVAVPAGVPTSLAPLTVSKTWSSIRKKYAVRLAPGPAPGPDVRLVTSEGDIHASVYLLGSAGRPARIELHTSDGSIKLRLSRERGQAVDVQAVTSNGALSPPPFAPPAQA